MKIPIELLIDSIEKENKEVVQEQRPFLTVRDLEEEAYYRYIKKSQEEKKSKKNENNCVILVQIWL